MLLLIRHHEQAFFRRVCIRIAKHPGTPERQRNNDQHRPREHKAPHQVLSLQSRHSSFPEKPRICFVFNLLLPLSTRSPCSLRLFGRDSLFSRLQNARAGHCVCSVRNRLAHFIRELCQHHFVGFVQQVRQFLASHCVSRLQRYPLRARQVRRRNNVLPLRQLRKFVWRSFERQPHRGRLERRHRVHFPTHLKQQVRAPLNLLGGSGKRQAQLAQPFRVHPPSVCQNRPGLNPFESAPPWLWAVPLCQLLPPLPPLLRHNALPSRPCKLSVSWSPLISKRSSSCCISNRRSFLWPS